VSEARFGPSQVPVTALIVAAGRGTRAAAGAGAAGAPVPKQYAPLAPGPGGTVLARTLRAFLAHPRVASVAVVIHADDRARYEASLALPAGVVRTRLLPPVIGGATRQASVRAGLEALAARVAPEAIVLVHDAARPFVDAATIDRVIAAVADAGAAIAALPLVDTLKKAGAAAEIAETVERAGLWRAQTPQGFRLGDAVAMHRAALAAGREDFTDDAALAEWQGRPVRLVEGAAGNVKITTAADLAEARLRIERERGMETRIGQGFDVHRFAEGDHVWLGGVRIPHTQRLDGHSDADVVLHALTDALLGAIGDGDIGQHFPPSDMRWKGAASELFLADAARRVAERGGRLVNVDVTVLCEAPRIGPHREAMRARIAAILGLTIDRVGVKATTTEQLGFTGRREGIAAMAVAAVALPSEPRAGDEAPV
jgi:2-C-methyl-D-erythritol 4-phosphate cytidylyltransferase/2-C-methyl-D-erythritol 2,4-cyclodiphosphate synthase